MKPNKIRKKPLIRTKIVVRLWILMMLLVAVGIASMWVAQIFLFERNYIDSTISGVQDGLAPIQDELKTKDLAENEQLILSLSRSTSGKMALCDNDGNVVALYSGGHILDAQATAEMTEFIKFVIQSDEYQQIVNGHSYNKIIRLSDSVLLRGCLNPGFRWCMRASKAQYFFM